MLNRTSGFLADVLAGLTASQKYLPSKYFYDAAGDRLFQQIMHCPEYYPFRCELEIFRERTAELAALFTAPGGAFDLIELGAGDCEKSSWLLRRLVHGGTDFTYMPIDISPNIIDTLQEDLPARIPGLCVTGLNGEYFEMLQRAARISGRRKVILFLGSNLGNMPPAEAAGFCRRLRSFLHPGDLVLVGLDLKKNPATVLAAYNDKGGITREFNLNLLRRINRELGGDFDLSGFEHFPTYDPGTGGCKSYLVSLRDHVVSMQKKVVRFTAGETIFMEISQKYTPVEIESLGRQASFAVEASLSDRKGWFVDQCWKAIGF